MKNISGWVSIILGLTLVGTVFFFQSELVQRDAEISKLKEQYNQLIKDTNDKLQEANQRQNEIVEEANKKLQSANQPEVPVTVGFRGAFFGSGSVAHITNQSNQSIAVKVIDGGMSKEIGEQEGWAFVSGDTVTIEQAGHKSRSYPKD
jgi:hypothetical protein